ncbi:hypothetical protein FQN57_006969 [Myotisia sp. PD_48]|nr:hypothetical protein FQN57_006969 [Myotisia sp. PD_48]
MTGPSDTEDTSHSLSGVESSNRPFDEQLLDSTSLDALQSTEQCELLDLVNQLRSVGLSSILNLPQIVVCGDQSSGKSSVLEAIAGIPFSRKENLCTRFATEIIMRRDTSISVNCKMNPDCGRPEEEQIQLRNFCKTIKQFGELPSLIEDASAAMGLDDRKSFGKDVLSIEISGPNRPHLTLVDLPGLIHSPSGFQSEEDIELVKSLVTDYISEKRTIILAVVSAKNDYANQIILKTCREFDPQGAPKNKDIQLQLGWHLLKNRGDDEQQLSLRERDLSERTFFDSGNYGSLPTDMKGIGSLRERLSGLLFSHLKQELPILKEELECEAENARTELHDQRAYLADLFSSAHDKITMGKNGNYECPFFGSINIKAPIDGEENSRRLRAVVQHLNLSFADILHRQGHKYTYVQKSDGGKYDSESQTLEQGEKPTALKPTRAQVIRQVVSMLDRSRGRELPGVFNPVLISHLFWETSEGWRAQALKHIQAVTNACRAFLLHVINCIEMLEVRDRVKHHILIPALKIAKDTATKELDNIQADIHYFTDAIQKVQRERLSIITKEEIDNATEEVEAWTGGPGYEKKTYLKPAALSQLLDRPIEQNMDNFSAQQALDAHDSFYKAELKYFIDVVVKQVIERHLIAPRADVFSPKVLARYSDEEIHRLAFETSETAKKREQLETKHKILEQGQEAFSRVVGYTFSCGADIPE